LPHVVLTLPARPRGHPGTGPRLDESGAGGRTAAAWVEGVEGVEAFKGFKGFKEFACLWEQTLCWWGRRGDHLHVTVHRCG
jgi:hypothetical protein